MIPKLMKLYKNRRAPKSLQAKKVLITAGPTQEFIDPIRCLTNPSSGKMGYALARAAQYLGADVILVTGPVNLALPKNMRCIKVQTALEMAEVVAKEVAVGIDIFIAAAAVSDYRPAIIAAQKLKKQDDLTLSLVKNPDILASLGQMPKPPFLVGFAAETEQLLMQAEVKLRAKNLDLIVANQVSAIEGQGIGADTLAVTVLNRSGQVINFNEQNKVALAEQLMLLISENFLQAVT